MSPCVHGLPRLNQSQTSTDRDLVGLSASESFAPRRICLGAHARTQVLEITRKISRDWLWMTSTVLPVSHTLLGIDGYLGHSFSARSLLASFIMSSPPRRRGTVSALSLLAGMRLRDDHSLLIAGALTFAILAVSGVLCFVRHAPCDLVQDNV